MLDGALVGGRDSRGGLDSGLRGLGSLLRIGDGLGGFGRRIWVWVFVRVQLGGLD